MRKNHEKKGRNHTYIRPKRCVWRRLGRFRAEFEYVGRPANPQLGVRVWPGLEKPNPYPYPAVPGGCTRPGRATRDNPYARLQHWVPYHLFLFQSTLYPFQPLYPSSDYSINHLILKLTPLDGVTSRI